MMKRKLVFATNNAHKLEEVAAILGDQVELLSLNDIGCQTDIPETAETLETKSDKRYRSFWIRGSMPYRAGACSFQYNLPIYRRIFIDRTEF